MLLETKRFLNRLLARLGYKIVRWSPRPIWPEDISRFAYQRMYNDFAIEPGSVVLDIGSGADPFPLATILTDRFLGTTHHRARLLVTDNRPLVISDIEHLPFGDRTVDFVYCAHVLEHVSNPLAACGEIVRVGKRGYIETPTFAKDILFSWAKGMHKWYIVGIARHLVFFEYSERQLLGVQSNLWESAIMADYHHPLQDLYYRNPDLFNVMFRWVGGFECSVYHLDGRIEHGILT
jgi:SAM-dependent methyltransferase